MQKNWKCWLLIIAMLSLLLVVVGCSDGSKQETPTEKAQPSTEATAANEHRIIAGTVVVADILDKLELDAIAVPETEKH